MIYISTFFILKNIKMGSIELNRVKTESYNSLGSSGGLVTKSCPTLATPWIVARQSPLSMAFSRHEYWSGLPGNPEGFPSPGDLPAPGIEPRSPALQADSSPTELRGKTSLD